ncbi:MAG: hypothetical protein ABW032_11655 [Burkholderiaceae bacterium]
MTLVALSATFTSAHAVTPTWIGKAKIQQGPVQVVPITAPYPVITFDGGSFDEPFTESPVIFQGGNGIANAIQAGTAKAAKDGQGRSAS